MQKSTRTYLWVALAAVLLQFVIFKIFYPFPAFFSDSYTYLGAAYWHDSVSVRPIGYSWFLRGVHWLSHSDILLVLVQYLLLQLSALYLFLTARRLYALSTLTERIFFVALICNPVLLYIGNSISSDALFISLWLIWFIELLWLMERPGWWRLAKLLLLLMMLFYVRYTALCCPVVAAVAFLLVKRRPALKIAGIAGSCLVVLLGVITVRQITWKETGTKIFTGFSGWQIANNALHIYPYISVDTAELPNAECRELDTYVKRYFDTAGPRLRQYPWREATTEYMWNEAMPLKRYYTARRIRENTHYFTAWTRVSPLYTQYGYYLIAHHPFLFARYYLVGSARSFLYPQLESMSQYNEGRQEVDSICVKWFQYRTEKVWARWPHMQGALMDGFRWLFLLLDILVAAAILLFLFSSRWRLYLKKEHWVFFHGSMLAGIFYIIYAAFSIYAAMTVFRYQVMPLMLLLPFTWIYYALFREFIATGRLSKHGEPG